MSTREIKFRAWDDKYKRMLYDLKLWTEAEFNILNFNEWNDEFDGGYAIMQYTGLKDKNGKEIYEGDIVTRYDTDKGEIIIYADSDACFGFKEPTSFLFTKKYASEMYEVIGNIHENPELLEK